MFNIYDQQSFMGMFLQQFPITCALQTVQGTETRNAAQLWPGASNIATHQDRFEHRAKNQPSTRLDLKHLAVAQSCVNGQHLIYSRWFIKTISEFVFLKFYLFAEKSPLRPKHVLFIMILKRKIGDQSFPSFCSLLRRINTFW